VNGMVGGDLWGVVFIYISFKLGTTSLEQSPREAKLSHIQVRNSLPFFLEYHDSLL
jgi:hypothetical protein